MARWVVGSILRGGPIGLFLAPASAHDWCNKGRGMCYPVYGMMHIKEPLLLIGKSSLCVGSGFSIVTSMYLASKSKLVKDLQQFHRKDENMVVVVVYIYFRE